MDTWTLQTGFPVVNVKRNYEDYSIEFIQSRFVLVETVSNVTAEKKTINDPLWWIPITYTTLTKLDFKNTRPSQWMRGSKELIITDKSIPNNHWVLVNLQQTGYYRVNYDLKNWMMIISHLRNPEFFRDIVPANRAQLIDDSLNLARAGYLDYNTALHVTRYLEHETDYVPWKAAINALNFIDSMMVKAGDYYRFKEYFLNILYKVYEDVGFEDTVGDDMLTVHKRVVILTAACNLGSTDCIFKSIRKFHSWMQEPNPEMNNP